ncbi:MAG: DNA polymerase/3'-5' exonuclease PolX [Candidatus Micrarchaeaceae archaeon]
MKNKEVARILSEIAYMLAAGEESTSRFEINAYLKAASTIESLQKPIEDIYNEGGIKALMDLPGIGSGIAKKIEEFIKTGKISKHEELKKEYPINFSELTSIEGLGPKKILSLYKELNITDIKSLKKAALEHEISKLPNFGEKSEEQILKNIKLAESSVGRALLGQALPEAESIIKKLVGSRLVENAVVAGSTRRMKETVGDLDILATSNKSKEAMDFFINLDEVKSVIAKGDTKTTVWLNLGISCDLRIVKPESFGAALQYFTGNKEHNIKVRKIAIKKGYKLNEYGLFDKNGNDVASSNEEEVYKKIGMEMMPPEMREDRGEVELALEHKIPPIIGYEDLKGDLHTHTKESDGLNTIEEMAEAAKANGFEYFATTNHTKSLKIAHGMNEKQFADFFKHVDEINGKNAFPYILKGAEVDILKDGSLDLDKKSLESMDCVVASVHTGFNMTEDEITRRVIKAIESKEVNILGHPTGRVIGEREQYKIDIMKVAEAAESNNVALEINSFINRLDLNDELIHDLSSYKIFFAIDSDAHQKEHFKFLRYGIGIARRGWLGKEKVINTLHLKELLAFLGR